MNSTKSSQWTWNPSSIPLATSSQILSIKEKVAPLSTSLPLVLQDRDLDSFGTMPAKLLLQMHVFHPLTLYPFKLRLKRKWLTWEIGNKRSSSRIWREANSRQLCLSSFKWHWLVSLRPPIHCPAINEKPDSKHSSASHQPKRTSRNSSSMSPSDALQIPLT